MAFPDTDDADERTVFQAQLSEAHELVQELTQKNAALAMQCQKLQMMAESLGEKANRVGVAVKAGHKTLIQFPHSCSREAVISALRALGKDVALIHLDDGPVLV